MTQQRNSRGFTLVELVVTIIILGIMAAVVMPKFLDRIAFDTRGFADQSLAAVQFGRKVAVATGRNVCVSVSGGNLTLTMATTRGQGVACSASVLQPGKGTAYTLTPPASVSCASTGLTFRADGTAAASGSVTVTGDGTYTITVETTGDAYLS